MKVGLILTEVGPGIGGRHTFQETLVSTVRELAPSTSHQFVTYRRGLSRHTQGSSRWLLRRGAQVAFTQGVQAFREVQDHLVGARLLDARTSLERQIEKDGVDLVWFLTTYAEDCNRPFIYTIFDLEHLRQPWFPEIGANGTWERRQRLLERYIPKATRVIVPNAAGASQLHHYFGVETDRILSLPHPTPRFALDAAKATPPPAELVASLGISRPYLFYPAQYWAHKNHVTLLHALRRLREGGDDYELVFVGTDQGSRSVVEAVVRELKLESRVHHLGFVSTPELVALYHHAHALTYASFLGPENLPPLEALALGCPVICAEVEGARDQLGDAAMFARPDDAEGIARAVRELGEPDRRRRLVAAGRSLAGQRSPVGYVEGVVEFLDRFETTARCWS